MISNDLLDNAPEVDLFADLTDEEKKEVNELAEQEIEKHNRDLK